MIARMEPCAPASAHRFCVAPMMGYTDRHARYLLRLLSRRARLYTEMLPAGALVHGDAQRALGFDPAEHPVAVQLGGSDPADLARAARLAERAGYDEVNLNVGCPSPRVQRGCFGAALMAHPVRVAECVAAMRGAVSIPVTVKTRIGIDDLDEYERLRDFVATVAAAGCATFIVHARKALLSGLSPKQNREVPPLRPERVYRLKEELPRLEFVLNGGLATLETARAALRRGVDGVMLGRAVRDDTWLLAGADRALFGERAPAPAREEVVERYLAYAARAPGARPSDLVRPLLGLYRGTPGARRWRRTLSEAGRRPGATAAALARECARLAADATGRRRQPTEPKPGPKPEWAAAPGSAAQAARASPRERLIAS